MIEQNAEVERPHSSKYLREYSDEHLKYEIDMFFQISHILAWPLEPEPLRFAAIESFVIHLRNLIDFLYLDPDDPKRRRAQKTDVVAADFCVNWNTISGEVSPVLEAAKVRSDKEVAHLTTQRKAGTPKNKEWPFGDLRNEIRPLLELFVKHAREDALSP